MELQRINLQRMHTLAWSNAEEILQDIYFIPVLKMFTTKRDSELDRIYTFNFTYDASLYYCVVEEHEEVVSLFCVQSNTGYTNDEQVPGILTFMLIDPTCANHCFMRSLQSQDWKVKDRNSDGVENNSSSSIESASSIDNNNVNVNHSENNHSISEAALQSSEGEEYQYPITEVRTESSFLSTYCQHYDGNDSSNRFTSNNKYQVLGWPNFISVQKFSKFIKNDKFAIGVR